MANEKRNWQWLCVWDLSDIVWEPNVVYALNLDVCSLRKDERRNYRADATTTRQVETGLKGKCWQLWLTYNCTSLDTIAGVIVWTGYGWKLAIRWRDVSQFVPKIGSTFVQGSAANSGLLVDYVIWNEARSNKCEFLTDLISLLIYCIDYICHHPCLWNKRNTWD